MTVESSGANLASFRVGQAIGFAWKRSWKNFWWLLLAGLVISGITIVAQLIFTWRGAPSYDFSDFSNPAQMDVGQMLTGDEALAGLEVLLAIVGAVVQYLVATFFALGVVRISLAVSMGDRVRIGQLFSFVGYGRYLAGAIIVGLIIGVAAMVPIVAGVVISIAANQIVWAIVGLVIGILLAFIFLVFFCLFAYAILGENAPNLTSLSRSWELVKPHFWAFVGLQILLALIVIGVYVAAVILGLLTLCFGLILTLPAAMGLTLGIPAFTYAYAYRTLSGQAVA